MSDSTPSKTPTPADAMPFLPAQLLTIEGPDAIAFAQAQLASDVHSLEVGTWQWSAWLNPQGRVRALFHLMRPNDDQLRLLLRGGSAEAMVVALKPYVMRSRVTLATQTSAMLSDAPPQLMDSMHADGEDTLLGLGDYSLRITHSQIEVTQHWRLNAIRAGHPWLPDAALDKLLAPSLFLQAWNATSLDKGCYPGQEIVARLHYRGGCKQHLRHIESDTNLVPGSTLSINGKNAGIVLDSAVAANDCYQTLAVMHDTTPFGETLMSTDEYQEKRFLINEVDKIRANGGRPGQNPT